MYLIGRAREHEQQKERARCENGHQSIGEMTPNGCLNISEFFGDTVIDVLHRVDRA